MATRTRPDAGVGAARQGIDCGGVERDRQRCSRRWGEVSATFTFLDPAGNLLLQSENFGAPAWTNGALIQLTAGVSDPFGTTRATRVVNAGIGGGSGRADAGVPGNYPYCLSVWAKTTGGIERHADRFDDGRKCDADFRADERSGSGSPLVELGQRRTSVTFGAATGGGGNRWTCSGCRWRRSRERRITR